MQKIKQIYRATYAGEHIITSLTHEGQDWITETEYIPNAVFSTHTSSQAIAIGNGESRAGFNLDHIANHKGGVLAKDKLQSYGCNALYRDFTPDFLVINSDVIAKELVDSGHADSNIVYATADHLLNYSGKFYLIPQNLHADTGSMAAYMACFDGHKKVFLLGYDNYVQSELYNNIYKDTSGYLSSTDEQNGAYFELSLTVIMETYSDVEFVRVMPTQTWYTPPAWQKQINFRQIDFRDFVLEADLG